MGLNAWLDKFGHRKSIGDVEFHLGLLNLIAGELGIKRFNSQVIKIAGTNGKGSAAVSLAKIYHDLGYKTAVYTSPHLFRFNERLKINNKEVENSSWCEAFAAISKFKDYDKLSYFEFITLAALVLIAKQQLDVIILEIGMGGRLDAVNIVDADIAFITSIGMDHNKWLGDTISDIAAEKAGITCNSKQLVCTERVCAQTINAIAAGNNCDSYLLENDFSYRVAGGAYVFSYKEHEFKFKTPSIHPDVVAGVLMCLILGQDKLPFDKKEIANIFPRVNNIGRCNVFNVGAKLLVDVAHNVDSAKYLKEHVNIERVSGKVYAIFSCLEDKDIKNILALFGDFEVSWNIYQIADERAMPLSKMQNYLVAKPYDNAQDALNAVLKEASTSDLIVAFGSFHVAKDILLILDNRSNIINSF